VSSHSLLVHSNLVKGLSGFLFLSRSDSLYVCLCLTLCLSACLSVCLSLNIYLIALFIQIELVLYSAVVLCDKQVQALLIYEYTYLLAISDDEYVAGF